MLLALKNIKAKTVKVNVPSILMITVTEGKILPGATISKLLRLVFNNTEGSMYIPFNKPQARKVQLAPCQKPLTINIMSTLRTLRHVFTLLPPKGIYK